MNRAYAKEDLENLIREVFQITQITPLIRKQIYNFTFLDEMTYLEIARCIAYYIEECQGTPNIIYGISFVSSVREKAAAHFELLAQQNAEQKKQAQHLSECQGNNIVFHIKQMPHEKRQLKQIDISQIDMTGENQ